MTSPDAASPTLLSLAPAEAEALLKAEALEADPPEGWRAADAAAASRDALAVAGDKAAPEAFLTTRARLVLSRMAEGSAAARKRAAFNAPAVPEPLLKGLAAVVVFLGFFTGAVTDQLSSSGAVLNLLSPPFLGLLLWNVVVVLLALWALCRPDALGSGLSLAAARTLSSAASLRLSANSAKSAFTKAWLPLLIPALAWRVRATLHLAALAFGVGVAVSLLVRGVGTAYTAGWESTWFAGRPDVVAGILHVLYGWIPAALPGLEALPGAQELAAMDLTTGAAAPGAPWLARMIWLIVLIVMIPRALLVWAALFKAGRAARTLRLSFDAGRLARLEREAAPLSSSRTLVILGSADAEGPAAEDGTLVERRVVDVWGAPDFPDLAAIKIGPSDSVVLALDPAQTPEDEVHGALIDALRAKTRSLRLFLDFGALRRRFSGAQERLAARRALWEHFAAGRGVPVTVAGMSADAGEESGR